MSVLEKAGLPRFHVEGIYPTSTMQEEMIFSTIMDPTQRSYIETYHFETDEEIRADELHTAILAVASNHSALRAVICGNMDSIDDDDDDEDPDSFLLAVVMPDHLRKNSTLLVTHESVHAHEAQCHVHFQVLGHGKAETWNGGLLWKLFLSPMSEGRQRITLSYHHSILDGSSARRLLSLIHDTIKNPSNNHPQSDIFASQETLEFPPRQVLQRRLLETLEGARPRIISIDGEADRHLTGVGEWACNVSTSFAPRPRSAAVPAWLARLALSVTLCAVQGDSEAMFMEMTSGRRHLAADHQEVLGLVIIPQIRRVQFPAGASLFEVARSLRTRDDLLHPFSIGELKAFLGRKSQNLQVNLVCQTDESFPSGGVGSWKWSHAEADVGLPLIVELLAPKDGSFQIRLRYSKTKFSKSFANEFGKTFCGSIEWLQMQHVDPYLSALFSSPHLEDAYLHMYAFCLNDSYDTKHGQYDVSPVLSGVVWPRIRRISIQA
ncbi:hypothetical protein BDV59DRAFT_200782 [Aspergillus ambiguus]|uniref:uncharacterized protein n=1 Tax=Aspergillus ambiguus TaxID=176160 RepID=UPI003CCD0A09